jgi:tetratricopeptide (TPR) repeat protein
MKKAILFLLFFSWLAAEDDVLLIRQAEAYFQAKDYERAYELYQKLLDENLAPWQRERLFYNLGTVLLEKGDFDGAEAEFKRISGSVEGSPYLSTASQTNLAILKYRKALRILRKQPLMLHDYSQAFFNLRTAAAHLEQAEEASCFLQKVKGRTDCRQGEDLRELRSATKKELALILKKYGDSRIADLSVRDGLPILLSGVNLAQSHLNFLETMPEEEPLKDQYLSYFFREIESWNLLWESQQEQMESLEEVHRKYLEGAESLRRRKYDQSRIAFLDSEAMLNSLMQKLFGDDPLRDVLNKLLVSYQYAVDQVPVQASAIYRVKAEQEKIGELLEGGHFSEQYLSFANQQLQSSLEYARSAKRHLSHYYLEEARQWVRRMLRKENEEPDRVLEDAIQDQVHALTLNQLLERIEGSQSEAAQLLKGAQKFTVETAGPFLVSVLAKEKKEWPASCQCKPWDRVVPLFIKGEQAARKANKQLEQDVQHPLAMRNQELAVKYWREALHAMRHVEEKQKEEKKEEEPETPPPPPERQKPKESVDEVMRQLQKMSLDDRQPKPGSREVQKGIRPW